MRAGIGAGAPGASGTAAADELDLGAVGRALRAKKLWVIVPTVLVAALTFAAVNVMTPRYKSEARILIEGRENVFVRPEAEKLGERERAVEPEAVTSQVQLVLSRDLARKVIRELKLGERVTAPVQLADGDAIHIGSLLVTFHMRNSGSSTETQTQ